jgi:hypothetical protein
MAEDGAEAGLMRPRELGLKEAVAAAEFLFRGAARLSAPKALRAVSPPTAVVKPTRVRKETKAQKASRVLDLFAERLTCRRISQETRLPTRDVRRVINSARRRGDVRALIPEMPIGRSRRASFVSVPRIVHQRIREAAESRGLDEAEFICRLVEIIVKDDMIDAILDDAD